MSFYGNSTFTTEYAIEKDENSGEFAAVYHLMANGVKHGTINIPKDMVIKSGEVVTNPDADHTGTFIKLVLQNVTEPLYINVNSLIEDVTGDTASDNIITVSVGDDHVVTATINDKSITKDKLNDEVQGLLKKADTALQSIQNGSIITEKIAEGAVTEGKIANNAITEDKLSEDLKNKINSNQGSGSSVQYSYENGILEFFNLTEYKNEKGE